MDGPGQESPFDRSRQPPSSLLLGVQGAGHLLPTARIGCSGWQYRHWRGNFYPSELSQKDWFNRYSAEFDTVELNNSFYRLPDTATFSSWADRAPVRFLFAVKASRFLTHMKKLKEPEEPVERFFSRARALRTHLGPVLYQLPPDWKVDYDRLEHFLEVLPRDVRHVLEFREPSWYADRVYSLMERYRIALCLHDMPGSATGRLRVGPFVYVRFHGASGRYDGSYSEPRLQEWAQWLHGQRSTGAEVYAYFNNDVGGHAPRNAVTLRWLVAEAEGQAAPDRGEASREAAVGQETSDAGSRGREGN